MNWLKPKQKQDQSSNAGTSSKEEQAALSAATIVYGSLPAIKLRSPLPKEVPFVTQATFEAPELGYWYHPVLLGTSTVETLATSPVCLRQAIQIIEKLEKDDYVQYLLAYYQAGLERFGEAWRYADIVTVLLAAARLIRPTSYLEIGVRRGRSMAMVASTCPECEIVGFDIWRENYASMANPGPEFVQSEIKKVGYRGRLELISGNSHETVPRYFKEHPDAFFDLITVDGDHSAKGAEQDLRDVMPRVKIGGMLVFDDISHPTQPHLLEVWQRVVGANRQWITWEFCELGYGVGIAIRKEV
ncbi:MAG: class I SAM-dependent methyltransferase [Anaerolineae bacterium]|nr:class I SAM-dependent methyltransferase [Anaerolineae bacterium]